MSKLTPAWSFKRLIREDEIFSSWLLRTAKAHGAQLHTFCALSFDKREIWTRDIDVATPQDLLKQCAQLSDEEVETIKATTFTVPRYPSINQAIKSAFTPWLLQLGVYHRSRKTRGVQFCPECWAEDGEPYFRKQWRYAFVTHCDRHESTMLVDQCGHCQAVLTPHRAPRLNFALCAECHGRIDEISTRNGAGLGVWMQQFLLALTRRHSHAVNFLASTEWYELGICRPDFKSDDFLRGLRVLLTDIRTIERRAKMKDPDGCNTYAVNSALLFEQLDVGARNYWLDVMGAACIDGPKGLVKWMLERGVTQRSLSMRSYPSPLAAVLKEIPSGHQIKRKPRFNLIDRLEKLRLKHPKNTSSYRLERFNLLLPK